MWHAGVEICWLKGLQIRTMSSWKLRHASGHVEGALQIWRKVLGKILGGSVLVSVLGFLESIL